MKQSIVDSGISALFGLVGGAGSAFCLYLTQNEPNTAKAMGFGMLSASFFVFGAGFGCYYLCDKMRPVVIACSMLVGAFGVAGYERHQNQKEHVSIEQAIRPQILKLG